MNFFNNDGDEKSIKKHYRELAKKHHPDLGGCKTTMQGINLQYEKALEKVYQSLGKSITEIEELLSKDEALRKAIESISNLEDISIEICGLWIWVTGNTKEHKSCLKLAGYFWAHNKKAWYWRAEENRTYSKKPLELDKIRSNHGSVTYKSNTRMKIE